MIRLLAVDMDGTCLDGRSRMPKEVLDALEEAVGAGILLVPTTGRCLSCLPYSLAARKDLFRYVITSNGAETADCQTGNSVFRAMIPRRTAYSLIRACEGKGLGLTAHIGQEYVLQGRMLAMAGRVLYGRDAKRVRRVKRMAAAVKRGRKPIEELQFYFLSGEGREWMEWLMPHYAGLSAAYTKSYVEIFSREASKGKALEALGASLGIRREEIACIGDGENDLSMFGASGLRLAMGNGVPELRKAADYVLPSNDARGAAYGIRKYVIGQG